jgi:hypothetical protein
MTQHALALLIIDLIGAVDLAGGCGGDATAAPSRTEATTAALLGERYDP